MHIVVNRNSIPYLRYFKRNAEALADAPELFEYRIYATEPEALETVKSFPWVNDPVLSDHNGGSGGHADALQLALKSLEPGKINALVDVDLIFFQQGWDKTIRELLDKVDAFGTSHLDVGVNGFGYGIETIRQYNNLPNTSFFVMSPRHDFSDLDTRPDKGEYYDIDTDEKAELFQLPKGFQLSKDTGWLIPEYFQKHRLSSAVLRHRKPDSHKCTVLGEHQGYCEEFHLDDEPFLGHQRGSWKRGFKQDEYSVFFYDRVENYLVQIPGYVRKFGWDRSLWAKWVKWKIGI